MTELEFCEALVTALQSNGKAELVYVTAEMQPFSNQQRPDILFRVTEGGNVGRKIFIEVKTTLRNPSNLFNLVTISEKKLFAEEYLETPLWMYILIIGETIDDLKAHQIRKSTGVLVLSSRAGVESVQKTIINACR